MADEGRSISWLPVEITPGLFPSERAVRFKGADGEEIALFVSTNQLAAPKSPYDTTAMNLRLSPFLSVRKQASPITFDLRKPGLPSLLDKVYEPYDMDQAGGYSLKPNTFVLGNTLEVVRLPIRRNRPVYAARVEGRSSFARCGLLIHFTAPTIHAGFEGTITFEIMKLGLDDISLYPDLEVGQLIFERVAGVPRPNASQYQGQRKPSWAKSKNEPARRRR